MDCDRNICYASESCDTCEIMQREKAKKAGKCIYEFEREVNQVLWEKFFTGKHDYGRDGNDFENDTFIARSYDWSDEDRNDWHFLHKPSGFKLQWYKYPLRSPQVNMEISHEQFLDILKDCFNSLHENVKYDLNKWWKIKG